MQQPTTTKDDRVATTLLELELRTRDPRPHWWSWGDKIRVVEAATARVLGVLRPAPDLAS